MRMFRTLVTQQTVKQKICSKWNAHCPKRCDTEEMNLNCFIKAY